MTLNLWARNGPWHDRRTILVQGIRVLAPDLIAFQECVLSSGYDQAADLVPDYHFVHPKDQDGPGICVASRWPVEERYELDLNVDPGTAAALAVRVRAPFGPVLFVNHAPSGAPHLEYEREPQAVITARFIEDLDPPHAVIAGNLSAAPDSASIRYLTGRQSLLGTSACYRDAWESANPGDPGHTYTPPTPG